MGLARLTVGLVSDMSTGLIDRFKSLPMSRAAVLAGRTVADLLTQMIGVVVVCGVGLAIGWRITPDLPTCWPRSACPCCSVTPSPWAGACLGMTLRGPEAAQQLGFILFLPLTFISNAFVPTQHMPDGCRRWRTSRNCTERPGRLVRHLFGNPNPGRDGAGVVNTPS